MVISKLERDQMEGRREIIYSDKNQTHQKYLSVLFASLIIDTHEGRSVQTFDVPGAHIHASLPGENKVSIKFER